MSCVLAIALLTNIAGAQELRLPATFLGDLPCGDCEAIRYHLDLWPDHIFQLHREWIGKDFFKDEVGRWRIDPARRALILLGSGKRPLQFQIKGPDTLRQLALDGTVIVSSLPYELATKGSLSPAELTLSLAGEMTYMADAARFTECLTRRNYPVAQEHDFVRMQSAYRETVRKPGAKLYVTFEGSITARPRMEGGGDEPTIVVQRFGKAWPRKKCRGPTEAR